jgi:hypothetical protein
MTDEKKKDEVTEEEVEEQRGEELPDREAMSILPIGEPVTPIPIEDLGPLGGPNQP